MASWIWLVYIRTYSKKSKINQLKFSKPNKKFSIEVWIWPRPSLTTGPDTDRNLAKDVTSTGDLLSIVDILKHKKRKCEKL